MTESKRRSRGASPRGNFEESKAYTRNETEQRLAADKLKTEKLRALRMAQTKTGEEPIDANCNSAGSAFTISTET